MGREVRVPASKPLRIVSLVPSQTELLCDLGLDEEVVGITKFCVHPAHWKKQKTLVGGTKQFRFEVIDELNPDLILGNKEENYREGIETLAQKYPVWMSDIVTMNDALNMIRAVGELCEKPEVSKNMVEQISNGLHTIEATHPGKAVYLIWRNPYMAAGTETFIHEVMKLAGLENKVT